MLQTVLEISGLGLVVALLALYGWERYKRATAERSEAELKGALQEGTTAANTLEEAERKQSSIDDTANAETQKRWDKEQEEAKKNENPSVALSLWARAVRRFKLRG